MSLKLHQYSTAFMYSIFYELQVPIEVKEVMMTAVLLLIQLILGIDY